MTPSRVAERVWQAMADPIDVSATSHPPTPPACACRLSLSLFRPPPILFSATHPPSSFSFSSTSSVPSPSQLSPHPALVSVSLRPSFSHPASPSSSSSHSYPLTSSPIAPTHRTKSRSRSPPLLLSSLFTMAMRYSHYPPCTSPSDRLHRDDCDDVCKPARFLSARIESKSTLLSLAP